PSTATASAATARKRIGGTERRIWISCRSGGECIAAGTGYSRLCGPRRATAATASAGVVVRGGPGLEPGDRFGHALGQRGVFGRKRGQRQAQPVAEAASSQQRLER